MGNNNNCPKKMMKYIMVMQSLPNQIPLGVIAKS